MSATLNRISLSTRRAAKAAGLMDVYPLCRKHMAVFFEPATLRAASVVLYLLDLLCARDGQSAPVNAPGFLRPAPSAEGSLSGLVKLMGGILLNTLQLNIRLSYYGDVSIFGSLLNQLARLSLVGQSENDRKRSNVSAG